MLGAHTPDEEELKNEDWKEKKKKNKGGPHESGRTLALLPHLLRAIDPLDLARLAGAGLAGWVAHSHTMGSQGDPLGHPASSKYFL